jgi:hypothetical protein
LVPENNSSNIGPTTTNKNSGLLFSEKGTINKRGEMKRNLGSEGRRRLQQQKKKKKKKKRSYLLYTLLVSVWMLLTIVK